MRLKTNFVSAALCAAIIAGLILSNTGCKSVDVFEKNAVIPKQQWDRSFQPSIAFNISDTLALYNIYVTLRHTYAYDYNNIWLNLNYQLPGDTAKQQRVDIQLADNSKGWLGTGMDDIYEVRRLITPQPYRFKNSGQCTFTLEQIMRENPLKHIMNAGIRVEKVNR
ncbi:MAG TPA: gliding motility lipoprotein GldH [Agriterribacter sp.]|nr:gliding motility lipoprotein GldH [Agriterribacter sp.]